MRVSRIQQREEVTEIVEYLEEEMEQMFRRHGKDFTSAKKQIRHLGYMLSDQLAAPRAAA